MAWRKSVEVFESPHRAMEENRELSHSATASEENTAPDVRVLHINRSNAEFDFPDNSIRTSRYTMITFLPLNLFEQFRRLANFYFLLTVLLQLIPDVSPFPLWSTASPLAFIIFVSAAKAAYEDYRRHRDDNRLNNKIHTRVANGKHEQVRSKDIAVGDIIYIAKGQGFPADVILLASSNEDRTCYVNTAELDGETAPKSRRAMDIEGITGTAESVSTLVATMSCLPPEPNFGGFEGRLEVASMPNPVPVGSDQLALRGSKLSSTEFVYAIVFATGSDTKLMLNRFDAAYKFSSFEQKLNNMVLVSLSLQMVINLIFATGNTLSTTFVDLERSSGTNFVYEFLTSFILFTYLIPISLYVTMEFVRVGQGILMERDLKMSVVEEVETSSLVADMEAAVAAGEIDEAMQQELSLIDSSSVYIRKRCIVKTTDIIDELGQVDYIMTDKTGTLTKNKMELKICFIDGLEAVNFRTHTEASIPLDSLVKSVFKGEDAEFSASLLSNELERATHYFWTLLVCNEVLVSFEGGQFTYQSLSPDEIAFAEAMNANGVTLVEASDSKKIITANNTQFVFNIHGLLKFSADRKRMTMVVEHNERYYVLCKGADSQLSQYLAENADEVAQLEATDTALLRYARDGNRTLVMVSRELDINEFNEWQNAYQEASVSLDKREKRIEETFAMLEKDMMMLGCTSVEDPLQNGVPQTIDDLVAANIIVIVLTGDKQETAVAIGKQANIIHSDTHLIMIDGTTKSAVKEELTSAMTTCTSGEHEKQAMVINGDSLALAIVHFPTSLLNCLSHCQTIICSRATPSQKAGMVNLVKTDLGKTCLAIGDGANDVSMIQESAVGVGLTGKEGSQASQAADFVLHRFRHLSYLLFIHGRYSYLRMTKVVLWSFYKNICFPFPIFWYGFFNSFSDQSLYDATIMTTFNMIFTVLPPIAIGLTEKDAPDQVLLKNPETYSIFRDGSKFTVYGFLKWVSLALTHASVIFLIAFGVFYDTDVISSDGKVAGMWVFGMWICTSIIIVINGTFLLNTINFTPLLVVSCLAGILVYIVGWAVWGNWLSMFPDIYGVADYIFIPGMSYLFQLIVTSICLCPIMAYNQYFPL